MNEWLRYLSKPWLTNQIGLYRLVFDSRCHHLIGCNWKSRPLFRQFKLWHRPTGSSVRLVYLNHGCSLCLVGSFPLYRLSITALASGTSSDFCEWDLGGDQLFQCSSIFSQWKIKVHVFTVSQIYWSPRRNRHSIYSHWDVLLSHLIYFQWCWDPSKWTLNLQSLLKF